jgi:hypothetical protein
VGTCRRQSANEEGKRKWICWRYLVYTYESGTLKPVKVILRSEGRGRGRTMEGMNQTEVQHMYIWKCHNEISCKMILL